MQQTVPTHKKGFSLSRFMIYVSLWIGALISLFPFYWMFVIGTNTADKVNETPPALLPGSEMVRNFMKVMEQVDFFSALANTFITASVTTIGVLFLCSLAGFAFAKLNFPGKNIWFGLLLVTMMVPTQLGLIPSYMIITELGWLNDLKALIVPGLVNAFGVFWMRQYISDAIPDDVFDSAKIDGCSHFRIYWNIVVPTILPAFSTLGIITFMFMWNDFLWPVTVLTDNSIQTLQVAIRSLNDVRFTDYGMVLSGTFWATVPLVIVFLLFNKWFISGLTQGSIK
ncbi:carbohydrate ABC transporter permease [Lihuaxuella thermophila]|uniref:Cellobiose transport system permease protein n=1 Tax=Lihuaxuella thermophila TaxID=1173111 RepID=A0A1H8FEF9_9BACL|nr:carbohydrate ABC transporter permease [Lihuaxuella thermophila]SEN29995.1 cellobiose transport system permease protein [Lihuaxuella thermophila]